MDTRLVAVFFLFVVALGASFGYIRRLQAENASLNQQRLALKDSLKQVATYTDDDGDARAVFGRTDFVAGADTIGSEFVPGETGRQTDVTVDPAADTARGQTEADSITTAPSTGPEAQVRDTVYVYTVSKDIGRYRLSGNVRVRAPGDQLTYDLRADAEPYELSLYNATVDGIQKTFIDAPADLQVAGLRSAYRPDETESEDSWRVDLAPVALRAVGIGSAATVRREASLFWRVDGFVAAGAFVRPKAGTPAVYPEMEAGVSISF